MILLAIEGPCCSGKTTFAGQLAEKYDCNVFHMDDFFLRPFQRTEARFNMPGGNIDWERFSEEVLVPLKENRPFSFRPFCCCTMELGEKIDVMPKEINAIEGSYSMHPCLRSFYTDSVFLTVSPEEQLRRLKERETPESFQRFLTKWLPMEQRYFEAFKPWTFCGHVFSV